MLVPDDLFVWIDAVTIADCIEQGVEVMQTIFGRISSIVIAITVVVLCWTGNLTGWFRSDYLFSPNWICLILSALLIFGVVRLIDRRLWVIKKRAEFAAQEAAYEQQRSELASAHEAHDKLVQFNNASVIEALREDSQPEIWAAIG